MCGQDREVGPLTLMGGLDGGCHRWGGCLKTDSQKDDLLFGDFTGNLEGVESGIDHSDIRPSGLFFIKGRAGPWDAKHVTKGCYNNTR